MCTDFSINALTFDSDKQISIIGRSMELGPYLKSELFFRGEGYSYKQISAQLLEPLSKDTDIKQHIIRHDIKKITPNLLSWTGKYNFIAFNGFATEMTSTLLKATKKQDIREKEKQLIEQNISEEQKQLIEQSISEEQRSYLDDLLSSVATNGMNDQGLTTGTMVLSQSEYQNPFENNKPIPTKGVIFYLSITTWILSNCASCQDVIDGLQYSSLTINPDGSPFLSESQIDNKDKILVANLFESSSVPGFMKVHFPVHDSKGNSIVLEYVKGQLHITDLNPIGTLTNDPLIGWHQENMLNNYTNVVPFNVQNNDGEPDTPSVAAYKKAASKFQCSTRAQGTGFSGLPGSSTPVDRFVRAAAMSNFAFPVFQLLNQNEIDEANQFRGNLQEYAKMYKDSLPIEADIAVGKADATTLAFHILNTVDIPQGTSRDSQGVSVHDYTQWSTVSDLSNLIFSVRMYESPQVFEFDLKNLNFKGLESCLYKLDENIKSLNLTDDVNKHAQSTQPDAV